MRYDRRNLKWNGWGWRDAGYDLHGHDAEAWAFLAKTLGLDGLPDTPSVALDDLPIGEPRLPGAALAALREALGDEHVRIDRYERAFHAVGKSYYDLIRLRAGAVDEYPDAVAYPADADQVAAVLRIASEHGAAVVPFGGGSSVVGGVEASSGARAAVITLDTSRLDQLVSIDALAHTATLQAGMYGPEVERALQQQGYTLGHYPQSFEFSTLGGWIAARSSGQQSNRYGGAAAFTQSCRVVTPTGRLETLDVPRSAAGPDLNQVIAGSEGTLGVIVDATVKIHDLPEVRDYRAVLFPNFASGVQAVREISQRRLSLAMVRLSDIDETHFYSRFSSVGKPKTRKKELVNRFLDWRGLADSPCVMMLGFEGERSDVAHARSAALGICRANGGMHVGTGPGKTWYRGRFDSPYLRDPMLDRGVGVDTLETATTWSGALDLHAAVREAILATLKAQGVAGFCMAHISHTYPTGTSLYFTFVFERLRDDEIGQWRALKKAASDVIAAHGATISHHHGVGVDHVPWIPAEKGDMGVDLIRALRDRVDPDGVLNPGKLTG